MEVDRLRRVLWALVAAVVAALTVSGVLLSTRYRPGAPGLPWYEVPPATRRSQDLVTLHRGLGIALLVLAVALVARAVARRRATSALPILAAGGLLAAVVISFVTGSGLDWDQLALTAVTVGSNMDGVWHAAFGDGVRFLLVDGAEVQQGTYATTLVLHLVAVPIVLLVAAVVSLVGRRRPTPVDDVEAELVPEPV